MKENKENNNKKINKIIIIICIPIIVANIIFIFFKFFNFGAAQDIKVSFPINSSKEITSYYAVNVDKLYITQSEGDENCTYNVYYQKRGQEDYELIIENISFSENDWWNGVTYSLDNSWLRDVRFKVERTDEENTYSVIELSIYKSE